MADITSRQKAGEVSDAGRERLDSLLNGHPGFVYLQAPDHSIRYANKVFIELFGDPADRPCFEVIQNRKTPCELCPTFKVFDTGQPHHWEWQAPDSRYYQIYDYPFTDTDGASLVLELGLDITESKKAEESLRLNSEIISNMAEGVQLTRARDGVIVYTNKVFERMFGYGHGELLGKPVSMLNAPADRDPEETAKEIRADIDRHGFWRGEILNVKKDGAPFWCAASVSTFDHSEYGTVYVSVHTDITERKQVAGELKEVSERISFIAENLPVIPYTCRADGDYGATYIGGSVKKITGYDAGEFTSDPSFWVDHIHPDDKDRVFKGLSTLFEKGNHTHEYRFRVKDGSFKWFEDSLLLINNDDGAQVHIVGSWNDITGRKSAEERIRKSEALLAESQTVAKIGSWDLNLVSQELDWSKETYRLFDKEPERFTPSFDEFARMVHPDDFETMQTNFNNALEIDGKPYHVMVRIKNDSGREWVMEAFGVVRRDEQGNPVRFAGTAQDITVRWKVEKALVAAKEEAERANRAKSTFLSSMSHEIRTPLTSVMGFSSILMADTKHPLNESQKDLLSRITDAGNQLLELVNDILDLSKIESEKIKISVEDVDVEYLARTAIAALAPLADKHGIRLIVKSAKDECYARADRAHLLQVLINLISNAIKYNKRGGEAAVSWRLNGARTVRISVSDTGHGIPGEKFDNLFKPFDRLGMEGYNIGGTGIGLTIIQRLVESMSGEVDVESEVGKGSTFNIDLPVGTAPESMPEKRVEVSAGPPMINNGRAGAVLYIEDNKDNATLVKLMLKDFLNIELISSGHAEEGIEVARTRRPGLILMDIGLPGMDGFEALKKLKQFDETRHIPVVAVSAKALIHEVEAGKSAGFDDYITKPIDEQKLHHALEKLMVDKDC